ncbi:mitochondrial import inner membrane translocase subunit TIM14-1-like isoform X4 [Lycium barbarum]|uniref:mitochondrial import inner membrane translocase subunit TIM14-1-like isoform X4 n=1 Tax=Lycium barbarum TaxID=112863 RepID=UPI00293F450F|nr:mitochondrial import inner membrane translocase subunit TIM14-1-like isoform X4 [Lycium barbarum]
MVAPLIAGLAIAAVAYGSRYGVQAWQAFKARPPSVRMHKFYEGGFQPKMNRREAALILGVRQAPVKTLLCSLFCIGDVCRGIKWFWKTKKICSSHQRSTIYQIRLKNYVV